METRRLLAEDGRLIARHVEMATSFGARARGLMLRRELAQGSGLAIAPCRSIHMLFMRFPLDAVFLDRRGVVVRVIEGLRPWRMTRPHRRARTVVELPAGTASASGISPGARLRLD